MNLTGYMRRVIRALAMRKSSKFSLVLLLLMACGSPPSSLRGTPNTASKRVAYAHRQARNLNQDATQAQARKLLLGDHGDAIWVALDQNFLPIEDIRLTFAPNHRLLTFALTLGDRTLEGDTLHGFDENGSYRGVVQITRQADGRNSNALCYGYLSESGSQIRFYTDGTNIGQVLYMKTYLRNGLELPEREIVFQRYDDILKRLASASDT